jgi:hypothetical protein
MKQRDALRPYLAHRKLEELCQNGREQSRRLGYTMCKGGKVRRTPSSARDPLIVASGGI